MDQPLLSPRAARTRFALIAAGMELLVERPVDAISIDEIVAAARVSKGSFFNHFADKGHFAEAVASEVRLEIEQWVSCLNQSVSDPLERLAGGMIASAAYALERPRRTVVLARAFNDMTFNDHPINAGLLGDLREALAVKAIDVTSTQAGVLFWLGACQMVMGGIVESRADTKTAHRILRNLMQMALRGLAAPPARIATLIEADAISRKFAALEEAPAK